LRIADSGTTPWVGLKVVAHRKDAEATHAAPSSTLGNRDSVLAGDEPNQFRSVARFTLLGA